MFLAVAITLSSVMATHFPGCLLINSSYFLISAVALSMRSHHEKIWAEPYKFLCPYVRVFVGLWRRFVGFVGEGRLDFDYEALVEFDGVVRAGGYGPVHHSRGYVEANEPAYRVVQKNAYQEIFG